MNPNPIKEWLACVAVECGTPSEMLTAASYVSNKSTRRLITEYAVLWQRRLDLKTPA